MSWFNRNRSAPATLAAPLDDSALLDEAASQVAALEQRADHIATELGDRNRRNHWSETVESLIWARRHPVIRKGH